MFNDAAGFKRIFLKVGYTDLRKGIPGLTAMIRESFGCDPYEKNVLFLFCGRRTDRIKGLIFEGDGFCLVYAVFFLFKESEEFMLNYPKRWFPDIFVHSR